jgi:HD-GYP domain-containing protein (c-di-GMP phosphodiesterase class II)
MTTSGNFSDNDSPCSGDWGRRENSAQAGFLPISVSRLPLGAYNRIAFYLRSGRDGRGENSESFTLYCGENVPFRRDHRQRLIDKDIRFVYIRMVDHDRFRAALSERLDEIAGDPAIALSERSAIVYETSVEIINELLSDSDLSRARPGLDQTARAVTTLVISNTDAFAHLFATSHHDFYTATHMVNVATWMVPLAYTLGYDDPDQLRTICLAGLLHDIGKVFIPEHILNKRGPLSDPEWSEIRRHPELGVDYLLPHPNLDPLITRVTREHHERLDGSGYPDGVRGEEIHRVSRICAVVDSFDAMTAFRPFKERTFTVPEAMYVLRKESPLRYDPHVVEAWASLLGEHIEGDTADVQDVDGSDRRRFTRVATRLGGRVHPLEMNPHGWCERPGIPIIVHNVSRSGTGFLCRTSLVIGEQVHVYIQGDGWDLKRLDGEVVRVIAHRDGWYEVGVHLQQVLENLDWLQEIADKVTDRAA